MNSVLRRSPSVGFVTDANGIEIFGHFRQRPFLRGHFLEKEKYLDCTRLV